MIFKTYNVIIVSFRSSNKSIFTVILVCLIKPFKSCFWYKNVYPYSHVSTTGNKTTILIAKIIYMFYSTIMQQK